MTVKQLAVLAVKDPRELVRVLFVTRTTSGLIQLFRYVFVGGFSALVDIGLFHVCSAMLGINVQVSVAIAFVVTTVVNYLLSIAWIFDSSKNKKVEFGLFTLVGVGGLILNEIIVTLLVTYAHFYPTVGKIISVCIVMFWSFFLRRFMFKYMQKKLAQESKAS